MAKQKVVVTRKFAESAHKLLSQEPDIETIQWESDRPCDRAWLLENAKNASGIILTLSDKCDEELVSAAGPSLKVIASVSVGTDHVSRDALKKRSIRLGYTPNCLTDAVADLSIMLTLMAQRRAGEAMQAVLKGDWPNMPWTPFLMTGPQITGSTVGFLGFGRIAQATLKRFISFGIKRALYLTSTPGKPSKADYYGMVKESPIPIESAQGWEQLASESDVIIVGCNLTPDTKHLVGTEFLFKMKKTGVLVNIARGPVVDTAALVKALEEEEIFGAGLDVIENEPNIEKDHPILRQPRCVVLPHVGSATIETRVQMAEESVKNLIAGLKGDVMVNEVEL
ncbi:hypothetical protein P154DRAFT_568278 [Amniculicola lignicola CBS 123094]|uniref:Glyoxylate reductase n=1 Tax=Amniculicola lignicola CBS 123094 TaxID=1392246 RepID=A0A6A5VWI5_9PLEO|nr:hypothetical protein P154DRAFT_568278 [Amniculicola lignicola CBS 123094]